MVVYCDSPYNCGSVQYFIMIAHGIMWLFSSL